MLSLRPATADDIPAVTALVNLAYRVEDFFKAGDRTDEREVREHLERSGFLLLEDAGTLIGSVYVESMPPRGYFGMLAVRPGRQRAGLGRKLVAAAEAWARERGCSEMDLSVASPRIELPGFYRRLGYTDNGTAPWNAAGPTTRPAHFILMTRTITEERPT
jgi:ribosomal protein S18 acetylase RimI-like enzyme